MKLFTLFLSFSLVAATASALELSHLSTVKLGAFDSGAAEMVDYDPVTKRLFSVNSENDSIVIIDLADPSAAKLEREFSVAEYGAEPTCVAIKGGLVAVTVRAEDKQAPGKVVFFTTGGEFVSVHETGALPDNVTFSPDGRFCVTTNEGEPSDDYKNDPEGSVTVITISGGKPVEASQLTFDGLVPAAGVRVFGPGATLAQDLEPEFVAISGDSKTAFVVCQENNAIAVIDLIEKKVISLKALGTKDHSVEGNGFDASDKAAAVMIRPWPVKGLYQPDAILSFEIDGKGYLITANEGDARDYEGFSEETRVADLKLDGTAFSNAADLQDDEQLGRLKTTTALGDSDGDGAHEEIYAFGARSFSIWDEGVNLVYDSGDGLERITAELLGENFNSTNDEQPSFKNRSDDKGPEPEALALGIIEGKTYAFVGLERVGGIVVFDITAPAAPVFVTYANPRDFAAPIESVEAGDLGPEDLEFIPAADSSNGKNLLISANEVSGTISVFELK